MSEAADPDRPLSEILGDLGDTPSGRISIGELAERLGGRALGALLFVFGLACALPLPPGSTTVLGTPLLLLALQLMAGGQTVWLPRKVRDRALPVDKLAAGLARAIPLLRRIEAVSRPRLHFLFTPWGRRAIGAVCTVLALVLILPIPLANMLPAAAVAVLSFSLVQRDGLIALVGYALAAASAGVLVIAAHIVLKALQHLAATLSLA
jgi:hypothetical protein